MLWKTTEYAAWGNVHKANGQIAYLKNIERLDCRKIRKTSKSVKNGASI